MELGVDARSLYQIQDIALGAETCPMQDEPEREAVSNAK
jgi:hypothetical protein